MNIVKLYAIPDKTQSVIRIGIIRDQCGMNVLVVSADKIEFEDATAYCQEIATRWNAVGELEAKLKELSDQLRTTDPEPDPIFMSMQTFDRLKSKIQHECHREENVWRYEGRKIHLVNSRTNHDCSEHKLLDGTCAVCGFDFNTTQEQP